jgi:hypothetical protein
MEGVNWQITPEPKKTKAAKKPKPEKVKPVKPEPELF